MDLGLNGKVALSTGASMGLGKSFARELAKEGAHVAICSRGKEQLDATAEELRQLGVTVVATQADVTKTEEVEQVVAATVDTLGQIDILINNAGDGWIGRSVETTDEQWQACIDINLYSAVRFTRAVVPHMRAQGGGRIINISTAGARTPVSGMVDYISAKAAMLAFSRVTALDLAPDNILVNSVCPAFIESPLWDKMIASADPSLGLSMENVSQMFTEMTALKRFGTDEEVSGLIAFLASERASFITGSVYGVDGGYQKSV